MNGAGGGGCYKRRVRESCQPRELCQGVRGGGYLARSNGPQNGNAPGGRRRSTSCACPCGCRRHRRAIVGCARPGSDGHCMRWGCVPPSRSYTQGQESEQRHEVIKLVLGLEGDCGRRPHKVGRYHWIDRKNPVIDRRMVERHEYENRNHPHHEIESTPACGENESPSTLGSGGALLRTWRRRARCCSRARA